MKFKRVIRIVLPVFAILVVLFGVAAAVIQQNVKLVGTKIAFPELLGGTIDVKNISYDAEKLASQVDDSYGYVYSDPQLTDYGIVSELGFDKDVYTVNSSGERLYRSGNKELKIDEYGLFEYSSGIKSTSFEMTLTDKECRVIAVRQLKELGIFNDDLKTYNMIETENGEIVEGKWQFKTTQKRVAFHLRINDNDVFGGESVDVAVNGNGEIVEISNKLHKFGKKTLQPLVKISDIIKEPGKFNSYINYEGAPDNLTVDTVKVGYWASSDGDITIQPIYIFSSSSSAGNDQDEISEDAFSVAVQANKLSGREK